MLLAIKDIKRLERKGFVKDFFVEIDKRGYAVLKNQDGYCVFYDLGGHKCSVYDDRPSGCRVYPVILDEEEGIVLDEICNSCSSIDIDEKKIKGKKVIKLLEKIDSEADVRRSQVLKR
jgi:hypothetical protein